MEILWRWTTPSVLLLFALNIVHILSQNVAPNQLPNGIQRNYNQRIVNQQQNLMFPPNQIVQRAPKSECPRPQGFQDGLCQQNLASKPYVNCVPFPTGLYASQGSIFNPQGQTWDPSESRPINLLPNLGPPLFIAQQMSAAPCTGPQVESFLPQQNLALPPTETFKAPGFQGPLTQFPHLQKCLPNPDEVNTSSGFGGLITLRPPNFSPLVPVQHTGVDILPSSQGSPLCSRIDSLPFSPSPTFVSTHFTPMVPTETPTFPLSPSDVFPSQRIAYTTRLNNLPQVQLSVSPPLFTPLVPIKNLSVSSPFIDILPQQAGVVGPKFDPSVLNSSPINVPPRDLRPLPAPSLPTAQTNCLPIHETEYGSQFSCSSPSPSQLQNLIPPYSLQLQRPALFTSMTPFQGSLPLPPSCEPAFAGTPSLHQGVCASPALVQDPFLSHPQTPPLATASQILNTPAGLSNPYVQVFPLVPTSQPPLAPLNSGSYLLPTDLSSVNCQPPNLNPQPKCTGPNVFTPVIPINSFLPNTPVNTPTPCRHISALPPVLSTSVDSDGNIPSTFKSTAEDNVPIPITLQINLPAPIVPPPKITIINTVPVSSPPPLDKEDCFYDTPYPLPPIIIEGGRSRSRSWMPLFLIALFA